MKAKILFFTNSLLLILCLLCKGVIASSVAVIPIEDLDKGINGVDMSITHRIVQELKDIGLDVIPEDRVISFMASNRIRRVGYLSTYYVFRCRDELGADLVLLGSVFQKEKRQPGALGLAVYLVRTADAKVVWSNAKGLSTADVRKILGIAEPGSTSDLVPILVKDLFSNWPGSIKQADNRLPMFQIQTVDLRPQYVSPGQEVICRLKLRPIHGIQPKVFLNIKGIGKVLMQQDGMMSYRAVLKASDKDGRYPVDLEIKWPSGRVQTAFLGSFYVDSRPPAVALQLKGVHLSDSVAFRDKIMAIPRLLHPEPVARWEILVKDDNGDVLIRESGYGRLPDRFVWRGRTTSGRKVPEGVYSMVLKVWDRADNQAQCSQRVAVRRVPPSPILQVYRQGMEMVVDIGHEGDVPIAFWRVEMLSDDGKILKATEGKQLPAKVDVEVPKSNPKVECVVVLRDVLGNAVKRKIKDLMMLAVTDQNEDKKESSWVSEF